MLRRVLFPIHAKTNVLHPIYLHPRRNKSDAFFDKMIDKKLNPILQNRQWEELDKFIEESIQSNQNGYSDRILLSILHKLRIKKNPLIADKLLLAIKKCQEIVEIRKIKLDAKTQTELCKIAMLYKNYDEAERIFISLEKTANLDSVIFLTLINGFAKEGNLDKIEYYLHIMIENKIPATISLFSTIVFAAAKLCNFQYIERIMKFMESISLNFDIVFFNGIFSGLTNSKDYTRENVRFYVKKIKEKNLEFNYSTYKNVIHAYCNIGMFLIVFCLIFILI